MEIITDTAGLIDKCKIIHQSNFIALDTEFLRSNTYFPKLCLIQVAPENHPAFIIDTLAPGIDISPFFAYLHDLKILKIFHAAKQDLEVLFYVSGIITQPIFDTQLAASFCGYTDNLGYRELVKLLTDHNINKEYQFTDWSARPLETQQLNYALDDVIYLKKLFLILNKKLIDNQRITWLEEEMVKIAHHSNYFELYSPNQAWSKLKISDKEDKFLPLIKQLAAWRERQAQIINIPKNHLIKEEVLIKIATLVNEDLAKINKILYRSMNKHLTSQRINDILEIISNYNPDNNTESVRINKLLNANIAIYKNLKLLLQEKSQDINIPKRIIANNKDLISLANNIEPIENSPIMHGWRYQVFGQYAIKLLNKTNKIIK